MAPGCASNEQAFEIVVDAMVACGFEPGRDMAIAVDVASTHFFDPARGSTAFARGDGHSTAEA